MNWDYIAGFFDGEGCIYHKPPRIYQAILVQKDTTVLDIIKDFLTKEGIECSRHQRPGLGELRIYQQRFTLKFLEKVVDNIIVKKEQAIKAINGIKSNPVNMHYNRATIAKLRPAIVILRNMGMTQRETAYMLSCGQATVCRAMKEYRNALRI